MALVLLVDEQDRPLGLFDKIEAHRNGGRLHRAFSIFVFDGHGRLLLQQRAPAKYHFGELWSNTCCGHPLDDRIVEAGRRRILEEMGFETDLEAVGSFIYKAHDPRSGLWEWEFDHLLVGRHEGDPRPNPAEVADWRWITLADLKRELTSDPSRFTPWLALVLARLGHFFK